MLVGLVIIIVLVWLYFFLVNHPKTPISSSEYVVENCSTGDLILFHALDNINAPLIGSYYTHVGIVYREGPSTYLFEAWNPTESVNHPLDWAHGIALTDLKQRLDTYRGYVYWKRLAIKIPNGNFKDFIVWSLSNMKYNTRVILNGARKFLLNEPLKKATNCGELVYLSLIKLGLLNIKYLYQNRKHHLRWVCYLKYLDGNYYHDPIYVPQPYFTPFCKN